MYPGRNRLVPGAVSGHPRQAGHNSQTCIDEECRHDRESTDEIMETIANEDLIG